MPNHFYVFTYGKTCTSNYTTIWFRIAVGLNVYYVFVKRKSRQTQFLGTGLLAFLYVHIRLTDVQYSRCSHHPEHRNDDTPQIELRKQLKIMPF